MTAMANAGTIRSRISENAGIAKPGRARGTAVTSPTRGTAAKLARAAGADAIAMARIIAHWLKRFVRPNRCSSTM